MKLLQVGAFGASMVLATSAMAAVVATQTPVGAALAPAAIVLKNDKFVDGGGQAYLQQGFVKGEMAGVWVKVPDNVKKFRVDSFRVLLGGGNDQATVFFSMQTAKTTGKAIAAQIENAAQVSVGNFFNDIPAQGENGKTLCANPGEFIGAAIEMPSDGAPSVYRDAGPIVVQNNLLMAIPSGWNYSASYGLKGNWILRVVGHEAQAGDCP